METDSASEIDSDNLDDTSSKVGEEYESDQWAPLKAEAAQQSLSEFEERTQNFTAEGFDESSIGKGVLGRPVRAVHLAPPMTSSFLKYFNLFRFTLIYSSLLDIFETLSFVYPPFLALYFWLHRNRLFIYSLYF